jgi:hypothetical protein
MDLLFGNAEKKFLYVHMGMTGSIVLPDQSSDQASQSGESDSIRDSSPVTVWMRTHLISYVHTATGFAL